MAIARDRWTESQAWDWQRRQPWILGTNFIPSTACNSTEMWQADTFDPRTMERELGWAADIGMNSIRVFVQYIVWKDDPDGLKTRFNTLLDLARRRNVSVMPVLFDDCVFGWPRQLEPFPGKQREPVPGMIAPSWTPCPGRFLGADPAERPLLKRYVQDFVTTYRDEPAILAWDLFNEPLDATGVGTPDFLRGAFGWAREAGAAQPLTVCYYNAFEGNNRVILAESDVVSFHGYLPLPRLRERIALLKRSGRPVICTEWMARALGGNYATDLPMFKAEGVGCFQWGLVNGRTQCQHAWVDLPGSPVDPLHGWYHDIFHADGTPYRQDEIDVIRRVAGAN